jgi:AbrB family looped-hinge helix DNA binding protein
MDKVPVKIGEGGRIVIPSEYRKALKLNIGDELMLHMENKRMILMTRKQAIEYVQERMASYSTEGRILSEELIKERKDEGGNDQ